MDEDIVGKQVKAKKKCCRSSPRCSRCPVVVLLAKRDQKRKDAEKIAERLARGKK